MRLNKLSAAKVTALNKPGLYGDDGLLWLQVTKAADSGVTKQWVARYMIAGRARKVHWRKRSAILRAVASHAQVGAGPDNVPG